MYNIISFREIKLKPQRDITTHLLEWLVKLMTTLNVGEDAEKLDH